MYVLYKLQNHQQDPRHRVLDTVNNLTLVEVSNPDWINWEQGSPRIVPDEIAKMYNFFGKVIFKGYQDRETGVVHLSKGYAGAEGSYIKIERPFTEEEEKNILAWSKILLTARVEDIFNLRYMDLKKSMASFEVDTWTQQLIEAKAGTGPLIASIAQSRGISVGELAEKIKKNSEKHSLEVGKLIGQQQRHIRDINACETLKEIAIVAEEKFGILRHPQYGEPQWADFQVHI